MSPISRVVLIAALAVAGCAALPREELQPTERGEVKTGTNITRERDSKTQAYKVEPGSITAPQAGRRGGG